MLGRWPLGIQLIVFLLLVGVSTGLWISRDIVSDAIASLGGSTSAGPAARKQRGQRPLPVIVARVKQHADVQTIAAVGTARANRAVMLNAKADGIIVARYARAGDRVSSGDVLFTLDTSKAALQLKLAEKRLDDATRTLERRTFLSQNRVNSEATVEDARSAVRQAQLEVEQYMELMRDLNVTAPFTGVVGISRSEVGDRVSAGAPLIPLDDRGELIVEFDVPEQHLPQLELGGPVQGATPSYPQKRFEGVIAAIDSRVDPLSRTVVVRASLDNTADELRPGMSFAITIELPGKALPSVPQLALQWRGGDSYIWVIDDGKARRQPVTAVRRTAEHILLEGEINVGDVVVIEGVQRLRPGRAVAFEQAPADGKG